MKDSLDAHELAVSRSLHSCDKWYNNSKVLTQGQLEPPEEPETLVRSSALGCPICTNPKSIVY